MIGKNSSIESLVQPRLRNSLQNESIKHCTDESSSSNSWTETGHFFIASLFKKQAYCHHCMESMSTAAAGAAASGGGTLSLSGSVSKGFKCQVCNFVCHETCRLNVSVPCLIVTPKRRPVAHVWSQAALRSANKQQQQRRRRRRYCNVCRERLDDCCWSSLDCQICTYKVHEKCKHLVVCDCRDACTYTPSLKNTMDQKKKRLVHHWREGGAISSYTKCTVCKKYCYSSECLSGLRCEWCGLSVHSECVKAFKWSPCDLGQLKRIIIPPYALSLPRIGLKREIMFNTQMTVARPIANDWPSSSSSLLQSHTIMSTNAKTTLENESECEMINIYDGDRTVRYGAPTLLSLPVNCNYGHVLKYTMRAFLINDDDDDGDEHSNYILTVIDEEERFSCTVCQYSINVQRFDRDSLTVNFLQRLKKSLPLTAQTIEELAIVLRANEFVEPFKSTIKIYTELLSVKEGEFCLLTKCNSQMTVTDVINNTLKMLNIEQDTASATDLCLVDSCFDEELNDLVLNDDQKPLLILKEKRKESLLTYARSRFYLQYKRDPHGCSLQLFVGNLPQSMPERKYEQMIGECLGGQKIQFRNLDVIYYEHGATIVQFESGKDIARAYRVLSLARIDDRKLSLMILPCIQVELLSSDSIPLLIFVNTRSGGQQGIELIGKFRQLVNPYQVFDLEQAGPLPGLYLFRRVQNYRILVCGGDGTIGWVLSCLDNVRQDSVCQSPPIAILPLGTGNDLARVLRWGSGYNGVQKPLSILQDTIDGTEVKLDRWTVVIEEILDCDEHETLDVEESVDNVRVFVMNNYFSIGVDAGICLDFHTAREENPSKFNSRIQAKGYYFKMGLREMVVGRRALKDFCKEVNIEVDGRSIALPAVEGIIILNIISWCSGSNPWGTERDGRFTEPNHYDGLLEIIGLTGVIHLGQIKSGIRNGIRIAQGDRIHIKLKTMIAVQVDGEPWLQSPCSISITKSALKATMLRKQIDKLRRRNTEPDRRRGTSNVLTDNI